MKFDETMPDPTDPDLSSEYLQSLKNAAIVKRLSDLGDDVSLTRNVDHLATFEARKDRELFVDFLLTEGFEIVSLPEPDDVRIGYEVAFSRKDAPAKIDEAVLPLVARAQALGGVYEGWNCEVIAS